MTTEPLIRPAESTDAVAIAEVGLRLFNAAAGVRRRVELLPVRTAQQEELPLTRRAR